MLFRSLRAGMTVEIRGSHDYLLPDIVAALNRLPVIPTSLTICTDDVFPDILVGRGGINDVLRRLIRYGLDPLQAIRCATINNAIRLRRDDLGQAGLAEPADRDRRRDRRPRDRGDQREEEHHVQVARGVIGDLHERGGAAQLLALEAERSDLRDLRDGDLGGPEEADQQDEEHDDPEFDDVARHARLTPL